MAAQTNNQTPKPPGPSSPGKDYQALYFSELLNRPVCAGKIKDRIGKLTDLVFRLAEPYPEAVGIYIAVSDGTYSEPKCEDPHPFSIAQTIAPWLSAWELTLDTSTGR
mgnify:CR=1 FL=1